MRTLMLLRHAKSSWDDTALTDFERPLNKRGRKSAPAMGAFMAAHGLHPALTLCSPALRTRQTLALVQAQWDTSSDVSQDIRLYEADASQIMRLITAERAQDDRQLMVVGHNDGMWELAGQLTAGDPPNRAQSTLLTKFPTGALAVFDCPVERWADLTPQHAILRLFQVPRQLANRHGAKAP